MRIPLSILDLAPAAPGQSATSSISDSVALARRAEDLGYHRVWYAEHHNMPTIMSSATSVLIAHIGAHTSTIRLGAGGIMLPNHAPLIIAEQFGTLAAMYPDRIDLGLGRAAGSDRNTARALRRSLTNEDDYPRDVRELQGFLGDQSLIPDVQAVPGAGSHVPLFILGSSMYGARLAAALGLPYAFASHFAPQLLEPAVAAYRNEFTPSSQLAEPYLIAGVNVIAADRDEQADELFQTVRRRMVRAFDPGARNISDDEVDRLLSSGAAAAVDQLFRYTAVGGASAVASYLREFAASVQADELITAHQAPELDVRLSSLTVTAQAMT